MSPVFQRPRSYYLSALVLVLVGVVIGLGVSAGLNLQHASLAQHRGEAIAPLPVNGSYESPFVPVVQRTLPAVVFIDVRKKEGDASDDPQEDLFRRLFPGEPQARHPRVQPASGSGFIIDPDGHILTNNHVVRDAEDITVTLNDQRTFKAKVIGADPQTDVAVIKINGDHLPSLPLGDSDKLRVGDWAIAIGNPLGELKGSVTVGIISAQGRSNLNIFGGTPDFQDFIQTDASINFGNSGGPLCNIRGEAIGINTAINPSGQGIGFAIPINLAKHVAEQLLTNGKVQRAWLGVNLAELTPEIAEGFGIKGTEGVLIQQVIPGQPADRAGLKRNDVIVELDGQPVSDLQKFRLKVADLPVGSHAHMTVLREGQKVPVTVTLGERTNDVLAQATRPVEPVVSEALGGLKVRDLTADERSNARLSGGVMVTDVTEGSAADEAGLQPNDIIEEVSTHSVASADQFSRLLRDAKTARKPAVLLVDSGGNSRYVPLRLTD
ncbi:MAG TPA: Do family serine endopeptidase [Candidatus Eisenbacteria bacterium]|nr:Do family serine endopeptidase [Candidatus Eisenbacteria bacterium]